MVMFTAIRRALAGCTPGGHKQQADGPLMADQTNSLSQRSKIISLARLFVPRKASILN
jgi:hypothetical protein